MRRLADELGVGAGAVYWHVENKEQLLQLVFDRVIGELRDAGARPPALA